MSSDVIATVDTLYRKADELCTKGHLLRAAENFGRAAEAARPLGADNLVALFMQLRKGSLLGVWVTAPEAATRILAAHRAEFIALLVGAVAALERRRAAGTLLEGKCTAAEEAWRASAIPRENVNLPVGLAAGLAALFGYDVLLHAAAYALKVLLCPPMFAAECSGAQLQSFAQHVVRAAELMQQPRRHDDVPLYAEATFTDLLRDAVAMAGYRGLDARLVQQLAGAWQRLERSGVLQARSIEAYIRLTAPRLRAFNAAVDESLTAPGLRTCALPGCGAREAHPAHFKSCAACRTVAYCCREHQVAGWPAHKAAQGGTQGGCDG